MNVYDKRVLRGLEIQHAKYCEKLAYCEMILAETIPHPASTVEVHQRIQRLNGIIIRIENQIKLIKSKENAQ